MEEHVYEFGPYRQDPATRTLTRHGLVVEIAPKAFDTLLCLTANAGRTVGREEILCAVWPDTFVEEGNLNYNISQLRKILGEYAPGVPYIRTLPKRGYRFIAEIRLVPREAEEPVRARRRSYGWVRWAAMLPVIMCAVLAAGMFVRRQAPQSTGLITEGTKLVRLTSDSGLTMMPALSPDSGLLAYASDRSGEGNLDLWVQPLAGGEARRLTSDPADDYAPSFSSDGRNIVFRSERDGGGIYVVSASGGEARQIVPDGRRPKFSPDGKWIAYWVGAEAGDTSSYFLAPGMARVYVVSAQGGSPRQLAGDFASAGYPIWAPDGGHLLFLGNRNGKEPAEGGTVDWWVAGIEGGPAVATGANAAFRKARLPTVSQAPEAWTAAGDVLFSANLAHTRNIWKIAFAPGSWKAAGVPRQVTSGTTFDVQPAVAGGRLAFASLQASVHVWALEMDTCRAAPADRLERLTRDSSPHGYPAISPDGSKLAYSSRRAGGRDIWLMDLRTGKERIVSLPPGPAFKPVFSPSGTVLMYKVADAGGKLSGYTVSLNGGGTERICESCSDYEWSSDEKRLALVGAPPARVSILNVASKQRTPLLESAEWLLWNAHFSPDDRWICFNATRPGVSRVFVAPVRAGGLIPEAEWIAITEEKWADKPGWSPDGNLLYFISERDGFRCIWAQPLDARKHPAGGAIPVFHAHEAQRSLADVGIGDLELSVARDKLVFNMAERAGNLWIMEERP